MFRKIGKTTTSTSITLYTTVAIRDYTIQLQTTEYKRNFKLVHDTIINDLWLPLDNLFYVIIVDNTRE